MNKKGIGKDIFLKCPQCGATNRLPALNKTVQVTCGQCRARFMYQPTQQISQNLQKSAD